MMNNNWKEYTLNGITVILHLDTKRHVWDVFFGSGVTTNPVLRFTRAKGYAVIRFLEKLKEIETNDD